MLAMSWIAGSTLLELVVVGSLVGLVLAVLALLLIWWIEWRQGRIW